VSDNSIRTGNIIIMVGSGVASGGQVGERALGRRPWGRNSTLFAVILNVFLSRNLDPQRRGLRPEPPFPALLLPSTITTFSSSFLVLNAFYSAQKEPSNYYKKMFCLCFFCTFAPIFLFKLCKFVEGGRKNISCPRTQGTQ